MTVKKDLYWIELSSGELWTAERVSDFVDAFIPGYRAIDPADLAGREAARREYGRTVASSVQQKLLVRAISDGTVDLATIPDDAIDRLIGYGNQDDASPWELDAVPLIVLGGSSESWRPPAGSVVVFDARDEGKFILSMAAIGFVVSLGLVSGPELRLHPMGF